MSELTSKEKSIYEHDPALETLPQIQARDARDYPEHYANPWAKCAMEDRHWLLQRVERLEQICAAAYQLAGLVGAPVRFLDALALHDDIDPEKLLPVNLDECDPEWVRSVHEKSGTCPLKGTALEPGGVPCPRPMAVWMLQHWRRNGLDDDWLIDHLLGLKQAPRSMQKRYDEMSSRPTKRLEHVCGLRGFGEPGDVCPACSAAGESCE